jgi:hypothetical protein
MLVSPTAMIIVCATLFAALGITFGALLVVLVRRPRKLWQSALNLASVVVPFVVALVLWAFIRLPARTSLDLIMVAGVCVLVVFGTVRIIRLIARSFRSQ